MNRKKRLKLIAIAEKMMGHLMSLPEDDQGPFMWDMFHSADVVYALWLVDDDTYEGLLIKGSERSCRYVTAFLVEDQRSAEIWKSTQDQAAASTYDAPAVLQ